MEDITGSNGQVQKMIKDALEQVLQNELTDYISDEKAQGNSIVRNGNSPKTVKTSYGNIGVNVPRVWEGEFEPEVIKKRSVVEEGLENQIISMYAKGMTVRNITEHIQSLYGIQNLLLLFQISPTRLWMKPVQSDARKILSGRFYGCDSL